MNLSQGGNCAKFQQFFYFAELDFILLFTKENNDEFESKKKTFPTSLYVGFINVSMYRAHKIHTEKVLFSERSALWNDHVNKKDEKIAY